MGFFKNLFKSKAEKEKDKKMALGVKKQKEYSFSELKRLLESKRKIDDSFYSELEEILILSDIGIDYTLKFMDNLKKAIKKNKLSSVDELKEVLLDEFDELYIGKDREELNYKDGRLNVFLFVGVNGSGKTTSIAKVAYKYISEGKKVLIAAGDTFRAGAVNQLKVWGERLGCPVISKDDSTDPSSVIFEGLKEAKKGSYDILLCDTAGRLQNKVNLMKELEKISRVIKREVEDAPHETLLVIDATTGQNGLSQAKIFNETTTVSGIILTKLDGTSKGGVVLSINNTLGIPIKLYGYGEKMEDMAKFEVENYLYNLFEGILFEEDNNEWTRENN